MAESWHKHKRLPSPLPPEHEQQVRCPAKTNVPIGNGPFSHVIIVQITIVLFLIYHPTISPQMDQKTDIRPITWSLYSCPSPTFPNRLGRKPHASLLGDREKTNSHRSRGKIGSIPACFPLLMKECVIPLADNLLAYTVFCFLFML